MIIWYLIKAVNQCNVELTIFSTNGDKTTGYP